MGEGELRRESGKRVTRGEENDSGREQRSRGEEREGWAHKKYTKLQITKQIEPNYTNKTIPHISVLRTSSPKKMYHQPTNIYWSQLRHYRL